MSRNRVFNKIALLCVALLLVIIAWSQLFSAPALSQLRLESRLNTLEFQINSIQSRLGQLESQLNRGGSFESPRAPTTPRPSPNTRGRLSGDPMFDRLATLVIELKQQVNKLEKRVSQLESK